MGYHIKNIQKGIYGGSSKIREEIDELQDAEAQENKLMALIELSDIIAAIQGYLSYNYPSFSIEDLIKMANATRSAFLDGSRK